MDAGTVSNGSSIRGPDASLGISILFLYRYRRKWVIRRSERVEFRGERRVCRHVVLDCEIPETLPGWPDKVPLVQFLPLTLLRKKQPLMPSRLRMSRGKRSLP